MFFLNIYFFYFFSLADIYIVGSGLSGALVDASGAGVGISSVTCGATSLSPGTVSGLGSVVSGA